MQPTMPTSTPTSSSSDSLAVMAKGYGLGGVRLGDSGNAAASGITATRTGYAIGG